MRVTEAGAMAAGRWVGRGDKEGGDGAAVDAIRELVNTVSMRGVVVIGEGEKDEAPMLYNGEEVGNGDGPDCDFAVDPIDGTTLMSKGMPNAISVLAVADRGAMFDPSAVFYMNKIAVGPDAAHVLDITAPIADNIRAVAKVKELSVRDMTVCILDRPRHAQLIEDVRATGARIRLITDGDVAGAISACRPGSGTDMLAGIGGTPEGIIAAAAIRCMGGAIQAQLAPKDDGRTPQGPRRRLRRRPGADHRGPGVRRQRLLLRHRGHRRRPAQGRALLPRRLHHPVDRDAFEVGHGPHDRGLPPALEAQRILRHRLHRRQQRRLSPAVTPLSEEDRLRWPSSAEYRIEHDTMGEVRVPAKALWRAQTQRAVENFPISGRGLERAQIRALGLLKGACAQVNKNLGLLAPEKADAIIAAAAEIADGKHDDQFPIDVFQTGSGTSSNMNTNEVIASIAAANGVTVHPNDDVNMSQSSNDTFPTATHIAATEAAVRHLIPALEVLHEALATKAREWRTVVKSGRTHLMDAVPVTLGQEFSGYARQIEAGIERVQACLPRLGELAIGGTAVGTGLNAPEGFGAKVVETLVAETGLTELRTAANSFEAQAARDGLVEASGALRTIAVSLTKIANDIRWMGSGPLTGLAEIQLPDLQPGSSIMPGKVNPVLPEAVTQVAAQVIGNDAAVAWGGASGAFELNVYIPMMARNILESFKLLTNVSKLFAQRCITGLSANVEHLRELAESSPSIVTPLNSAIGYEEAAAVAKQALKEHKTIRQTVIDRGLIGDKLSLEELDRRLDVLAMAKVAKVTDD